MESPGRMVVKQACDIEFKIRYAPKIIIKANFHSIVSDRDDKFYLY